MASCAQKCAILLSLGARGAQSCELLHNESLQGLLAEEFAGMAAPLFALRPSTHGMGRLR